MPQLTWTKLGVTFLILTIAFGLGFELRVLIDHSNERAQLIADAKAKAEAQNVADKAAADWENQLRALKDANKKLRGRLQNEVSKAVYSSCVVPDDGVRIFNDAIGHPTGGSDGAMPSP